LGEQQLLDEGARMEGHEAGREALGSGG